jgi:succinate dehydrogenase / fumarate reductase, flavoprotein subunit
VDITQEPMEIGPTCHYVMGGVEVDPDTQASVVPGLFAAGEVAGGMHGANRLGGNSLSDLLVFGKRAGEYAAEYAKGFGDQPPKPLQPGIVQAAEVALAPFRAGDGARTENPYAIHQELQDIMQDLVGIIRVEAELKEAIEKIAALRARAAAVSVEGNRQYNPGWHLALDLRNMLLVAESVALAALERQESRGGHTREDFPMTDPYWGGLNVVVEMEPPPPGPDGSGVAVKRQPLPKPPPELTELLEDVH